MIRFFLLHITLLLTTGLFAQFVEQPLPTVSPESAGYKAGFFDSFTKELEDSCKALGTFIVWRKQGVAYEHYFHGATPDIQFNIKSITKSMVSAMTGIAQEKKLLSGINTPVMKYLPEYGKSRRATTKGSVWFADELKGYDSIRNTLTFRQLLTMQPGFEWSDFGPVVGAFINSSDPVRFALDLPFTDTPGTKFVYCSAATSIVAAALTKAVGTNLLSFAKTNLFDPAGISLPKWDVDPTGRYVGCSEMYMTPRDLLRFGLLYLHKGKAGNKQIIPQAWIEASTAQQARLDYWDILPNANGYGYFWWRRTTNGHQTYFASGACGQLIVVVPDLDMVIVATNFLNQYNRGRDELRKLHVLIDKLTQLP